MKIPTAENRSYGGGKKREGGRDGERSVDDLALGHDLDIVSRKSLTLLCALTSILDLYVYRSNDRADENYS